ncbi:GPI-anchored CFEM domain protein B [Penicillium atrosanguineum]|uniref:GPI-anchored CFEM domain protein B n=1 Tax=Penicillium atrosanguineum TaxID=1132637 RepID=UPI002392099F|nr:GPI-anchored CFEM domain protein B [Penicillium atrosanguineum]KAJ5313364.1 GPI-anchored CFEM domain protein B [Penicillium atrosanguineum]
MSGVVGPSAMPSTSASLAQAINNTVSATSGNSILPSSPLELLTLPFRALQRAETFAFSTVPRHVARLAGIEDVTVNLWSGPASTASDTGMAGEAAAATANMAREAVGYGDSWYVTEFLQTMRKVGGFFGYLTSVWAFACLVEALILNRITIYASTRRHLRLGWERRLALRIIPILLFASQILSLLRGIRCQTSPDYSSMRYGKPGKSLIFDYASAGGALHSIASTLLPWESDERACSAVNMGLDATNTDIPFGSFSLLWPVFLLLCLSHFVETLSCALQGRPVMTETGMSIFEHSLAFAEAESMISRSIGLGLFGLPKQSPLNESGSGDSASPLQFLTRAQVLDRMNATPELLLIVLISCLNSLSSHILDVFGKQGRYRLFNTALWGFCFMAAMLWGMESGPPVSLETGVLRFPTVCIVGFVPHLLVLLGIVTCFSIYGIALFVTAFSLPFEEGQPTSLRERFALAHENMQGSNQIRSIHINRHEDFYTTLLRIGYVALTAASEAVFLNEGKAVVARQMTWLEKDRLAEIEASRQRNSSHRNWPNHVEGSPFETVGFASFTLPDQPSSWESGYNREKKLEKPKNGSRQMRPQAELGGVGAVRASVRLWHGISFLRSIFSLVVRWISYGFNRALDRLGVSYRPLWLKRQSGKKKTKARPGRGPPGSLDFWVLTDEGELELPDNHDFDVELEMRKRERSSQLDREELDERRMDEKLYTWWRAGGSWGDQDHTPDFDPPGEDDDTTSVISMSTNASESEWEDYPSDGRRTPTQEDPYPQFSREGTPHQDALMDLSAFARLLDPRDRETREEARILAAHLSPGQGSGRIMTRSQYQQQVERERSRVLLSSRLHHAATNSHAEHRKPSADEEAEMLEKLILSRRADFEKSSNTDSSTWESGAMGLGENGPPCVVCQTSPRSIITWPCRCLCICEDCRVSLAMNNFGSCVTCRQEVGGFMRLWVP